ncbi:hypothetical protein [Clostridium arbusti]|uniref:hypothetical protein n=1 Tax=Clostridium arbusti TaxID=1137848 RepID=UPI0002E5A448|nr:hypothetical protein [Clostridium arbusti]
MNIKALVIIILLTRLLSSGFARCAATGTIKIGVIEVSPTSKVIYYAHILRH